MQHTKRNARNTPADGSPFHVPFGAKITKRKASKRLNGVSNYPTLGAVKDKNLPFVELKRVPTTFKATKVQSSHDSFKLLWELTNFDDKPVEYFYAVYLSRNNTPIGLHEISKGGVSGTFVDSRVIFAAAVKLLASGIILCHNHPSGNLNPSEQDIAMTRKLKEGGKLLDITVLDHIIVAPEKNTFYSFADEGII